MNIEIAISGDFAKLDMFVIGFMQGRLSPPVNGMIQSFPWPYWRQEFAIAEQHGFSFMEWTLDRARLYENPLMTKDGRIEIKDLAAKHHVCIPSLTGDCFMQAPFYKAGGKQRARHLSDFKKVIKASSDIGIKMILMPLIDNGRLDSKQQELDLLAGLNDIKPLLEETGIMISFESDYSPVDLNVFISKLEPEFFGITYDIGNSAALGYDFTEEINLYGKRIVNVHVKDRRLKGETVPLGNGNADIPKALGALGRIGYNGNYILQTARAEDSDHCRVLCKYRDMVAHWLDSLDA